MGHFPCSTSYIILMRGHQAGLKFPAQPFNVWFRRHHFSPVRLYSKEWTQIPWENFSYSCVLKGFLMQSIRFVNLSTLSLEIMSPIGTVYGCTLKILKLWNRFVFKMLKSWCIIISSLCVSTHFFSC